VDVNGHFLLKKEATKMKKLLLGTILLALISIFPIKTMAAVDIHMDFLCRHPTTHHISRTTRGNSDT